MELILKAVEAAKSLQLWVFVSIALIGYSVLYLPSFGGADLAIIRQNNWAAWLAAVVGTIASITEIIDSTIAVLREDARKQKIRIRRAETQRYVEVYMPLTVILFDLHIEMSSSDVAPSFLQRGRKAVAALSGYGRRKPSLERACKAFFDYEEKWQGEVEFGGPFPFSEIERVVNKNIPICDEKLLTLASEMIRTRIISRLHPGYLSEQDCALINYVSKEQARLKVSLGR